MLIDMHVHIFPDALAERALGTLSENCGDRPFSDGTLKDTLQKMDQYRVDKLAVLSIATNPKQQTNVNNFAAQIKSERVLSFGSVHFQSENALDELDRIVSLGLYGVKFHPDYQGFEMDDRRLYPIYEKIEALKLPVVFHTGYDPVSPDYIHATPKMILRVMRDFRDMKIICAHLGSMNCFGEVEELLVGTRVFFDTGYVAGHMDPAQAFRIINRHGAEKVLFASDFPWQSSKTTFDFIDAMPLTSSQKDLIYFKNAEKLLKI